MVSWLVAEELFAARVAAGTPDPDGLHHLNVSTAAISQCPAYWMSRQGSLL